MIQAVLPTDDAVPRTRHDWSEDEAAAIYDAPFMDLIFRAQVRLAPSL